MTIANKKFREIFCCFPTNVCFLGEAAYVKCLAQDVVTKLARDLLGNMSV